MVTGRTRLAADSLDRDDNFLLNPTTGHLVLEENIVEALNGFMPTDIMGNILLAEVMRWLPSAEVTKDQPPPSLQWGETGLVFEMAYIFPHDQTVVL
jgi:hypothetical protein